MTAAAVLKEIRQAQDGEKHGYQQALGEMRAGRKQTCWIWYVWPCMAPVRTTTKPQYSLPSFEAAIAYIRDRMLSARLREITGVAVAHLSAGATPEQLFGGFTDAHKFHECVTCFAVAAAEAGDHGLAKLFAAALEAFDGKLEETVMGYITNDCGLRKYSDVGTSRQFSDVLAACPRAQFHWNLVGPGVGVTTMDPLRDKEQANGQQPGGVEQVACQSGSRNVHFRKLVSGA